MSSPTPALAGAVLDRLPGAVLVFDADLRFELAAGRALAGRILDDVLGPEGADRLREVHREVLAGGAEIVEYHSQRDHRWYELRAEPLGDDRGLAIVSDVTERVHLRRAAWYDDLTGLPNRRRFHAELDRHLATVRRHNTPGALLVADLDGLKEVNDTYGHAAGDALLHGMAQAMRARLRRSDLPARLGGDEFAVLLPDADLDAAERVAQYLCEAAGGLEVECGGERIASTVSIGGTTTSGRLEPQELLAVADGAMYLAKRQGGDRCLVRAYDRR